MVYRAKNGHLMVVSIQVSGKWWQRNKELKSLQTLNTTNYFNFSRSQQRQNPDDPEYWISWINPESTYSFPKTLVI